MQIFKNWGKKIERWVEVKGWTNKRSTIEQSLLSDLTTEQSIQLFEEVQALFKNTMQKRLERAREEQINIEKFLGNGTI